MKSLKRFPFTIKKRLYYIIHAQNDKKHPPQKENSATSFPFGIQETEECDFEGKKMVIATKKQSIEECSFCRETRKRTKGKQALGIKKHTITA